MSKRKTKVGIVTLCKLGTIAHNRPFSSRDFREYTGGGSAQLTALVRRGVVEKTGRGTYYPTSKGWNIIERACRLRR